MDYRGSCDLGVSLPSESFDWLDFVRAVYVCHQLESPIRRYAGITTMNYIRLLTSDSEDVDLFKGMYSQLSRGLSVLFFVCSSSSAMLS